MIFAEPVESLYTIVLLETLNTFCYCSHFLKIEAIPISPSAAF